MDLKSNMKYGKIDSFRGDFRFLSNFYPCEIFDKGIRYTSTEHAYQAAKTLDKEEKRQIQLCSSPGEAKKLGRKITIRVDWEYIKLSVMEDLIRQKFSRHEKLKQRLLATEDVYLEESNNWHDSFWGICNGVGKNHLGLILMKIREELKNEIQKI